MVLGPDVLPDLIASFVVITFVAYVGLAIIGAFGASLAAVNAAWFGLYGFVVLMSATKLYGKGVYNAVKGIGQGLLNIDPPTNDN